MKGNEYLVLEVKQTSFEEAKEDWQIICIIVYK